MNSRVFIFSLLFAASSLLYAFDFGLVLDQEATYSSDGSDTSFEYKGILVPRFSFPLGSNGEFILTAGLDYQNDPWAVVPELLETQLGFSSAVIDFSIGRFFYTDPLGFIADGLFDGLHLYFDTNIGVFGIGAWYTGFLCKRRANIEMTLKEYDYNNSAIEYNDFINTYFAPKRVLAALDWEQTNIAKHFRLKAALIGQFDLTDVKLNSQYIALKMTLPFRGFAFDLGGCFELIQQKSQSGSDEIEKAFAAEMGFSWIGQKQGLSFLGRYSSGSSDSLSAFLPLTTIAQGNIIEPKLSALSVLSLDYTVRLHNTFSFSLTPSYFIDTSNFEFSFLGGELFGKLSFSPVSDIIVNLGGGVFMPSLGDVSPKEKNLWQVKLNFIMSFF